jgi:hypothetical protein
MLLCDVRCSGEWKGKVGMRSKCFFITLAVILGQTLLPACGMGTGPAATGQVLTPLPSYTRAKPTSTPIPPTVTSTNTWIPSSTPTVGPPPDLELMNVSMYLVDEIASVYSDYYFFGRVKNNTDQIMWFNYKDVPFKFTFDRWGFDQGMGQYYHDIYEDTPKMSYDPDYYRIMNCFLYPGDIGVIMFTTPAETTSRDFHWVEQHDGPSGLWLLSYESFYKVKPDLRLDWHPKAENLEYSIKDGALVFDYDIFVPTGKKGIFATLKSWTILIDKNEKIINILYKNLETMGGMINGKTYHVHATTATPQSDRLNYFIPKMELTPEMMEQVDHIEIFAEQEEGMTCREY